MRAIIISTAGSPGVLRVEDRPMPAIGTADVLVRVEAAGVNRPDIMQRLGKYAPPPGASDVPGLEIAGTIERAGDGVTRWRAGDRVCALVAGGGYAEYCAVPEPQCLPIPSGLDRIRAAAIPETYFTVWTNLFQSAGLRALPWGHERHRHDGHPAGAGVRRDGIRNRRLGREMRGVRAARSPCHQLPHDRLRRRRPRAHRRSGR